MCRRLMLVLAHSLDGDNPFDLARLPATGLAKDRQQHDPTLRRKPVGDPAKRTGPSGSAARGPRPVGACCTVRRAWQVPRRACPRGIQLSGTGGAATCPATSEPRALTRHRTGPHIREYMMGQRRMPAQPPDRCRREGMPTDQRGAPHADPRSSIRSCRRQVRRAQVGRTVSLD